MKLFASESYKRNSLSLFGRMTGVPGLLLAKRSTNLTHLPDKDGFFTPPNAWVVGRGMRRALTQIGKVYPRMSLWDSYFQS